MGWGRRVYGSHRLARLVLVAVLVAVAAQFPALAQTPNQGGQIQATQSADGKAGYTIKARVPLTILDIVVTDAKGQPVHGLKESDFTILEDKQPMVAKSFEEHRSDESAPVAPPPASRPLPANTFTNLTPTPPSTLPPNVLLLDSLNTPMGVQTIVRQRMVDYIKRMPQGTSMAIFGLTTRLVLLQGFTSDREVLLAALTKGEKTLPQFAPHEDWGQDPMQEQDKSFESEAGHMAVRAETTFSAIRQIARYLSGIPGRKNLLWLTGAFPQQYPPEPRDPLVFPPGNPPQIYDLSDEVKAEAEVLARAHIAVYSIEPRGLDQFFTSRRGNIQLGEHDTMDLVADLTGGKNTHNTNGLTEAVADAIDLGSNFYTVTYTPINQTLDTRFRAISVKVSQPGLHLAYRSGYYAVDPAVDAHSRQIETVKPMQAALMRGSLEPTQILFKVKVVQAPATENAVPVGNQPDAKQMKPPYRRYSISYVIDVNGIDFTQSIDNNYRGDFEFGAVVYNADGDAVVNSASKTVSPIVPPAVYQSMLRGGANAHQEIAVPATGDYFLRIAVHDLRSDHVGAVEIPTAAIAPTAEMIPAAAVRKQ